MANSRIKDLSTGSPTSSTYVPGDSTGTGTIKATITTWMVAGWAAAAALLANAAIAAQGVWTFANNVVLSQGLSVAGATTSASLAATGAVTGASVAATGAVTGATVTTTGLVQAGGGVDFTSDKGINCLDPTAAQDVATKAYVDAFSGAEAYAPTLASSGAGVLNLIGQFMAHYIKDSSARKVVMIQGTFSFTAAVPGTPETVTMTLPAGAQPVANFANTYDAIGDAHLADLHAATDFCGQLLGVVGAKKVSTAITDTSGAASVVQVRFAYRTS